MMRAYKTISALLDYPSDQLIDALGEIRRAITVDPGVPMFVRTRVERVAEHLRSDDLMTLQERYVETFDRSRRASLYLYEHVHGENRDRGMAMVRLAELYRLHGFELAQPELPDYLPLLLEFLAQIPEAAAASILADAVDVLEAIRRRLAERESPYAALLEALVHLSGRSADPAEVDAIMTAEPPDARSNADLDAEWAEEPITFGAGSALGACPHVQPGSPAGPMDTAPRPMEG